MILCKIYDTIFLQFRCVSCWNSELRSNSHCKSFFFYNLNSQDELHERRRKMNSKEFITYQKSRNLVTSGNRPNIKETVSLLKNSTPEINAKRAMLTAINCSNQVIEDIYSLALNQDMFPSRWLLVRLSSKKSTIEVCSADEDYRINHRYSVFNSIVAINDTDSHVDKELVSEYAIEYLKDFLEEEGFCNIGSEVPRDHNGIKHSGEENEWYALEIG